MSKLEDNLNDILGIENEPVSTDDFKAPTVKRAGGIFGGLLSKLPPEIRRAGRDVLNELRRKAPIGRITGGRVFPPFKLPPLKL